MNYILGTVICVSLAFSINAQSPYYISHSKVNSCNRYKEISDSLFDSYSNEAIIILENIEQVLEADPLCIKALEDKAYIFYRLEEFEKALAPATVVLEFDSNNYDARVIVSDSYHRIGSLEKSAANYTHAIALFPDKTFLRVGRAHVYFDQKEYDRAYQDLLIAKNDWENKNSYYNMLMASLSDVYRRHEEAIMYLNRSFKLGYDNCEGYYLRGANQYLLGNNEEAVVDLHKSIHGYSEACLGASIGPANFFLGQAYFRIAQYYKAMPYLRKAYDLGSLDEMGYYSLSYALLNSGEVLQAEKVFKEALELFPVEGIFPSGMADVMVAKGEEGKARDYLIMAVEKGSRFVDDSATYYIDICDRLLNLHDTLGAFLSLDRGLQLLPGSDVLLRYKLALIAWGIDVNGPELMNVVGDLIQLYAATGQRDKQAFYLAYKAIREMELGQYESSVLSISDAIEMDNDPEYYATRSIMKFWYHRQIALGQGENSLNSSLQDMILDDVRVSLSSGHRTKDVLLLKMGYMIIFERLEESCVVANEVINSGGYISDVQWRYLCGETKEIDEDKNTLSIDYELSPFDERFGK